MPRQHVTKLFSWIAGTSHSCILRKTRLLGQRLSALSKGETTQFRYGIYVVHYGTSVAVVRALLFVDALRDGQPWPAPTTAVTDVWEKRGGKWQVVTRYAVRPEEIKPRKPSAGPN
jgi:hypothetical protein